MWFCLYKCKFLYVSLLFFYLNCVCNVCISCDEGYLGQHCECVQQSDADSTTNMLASCRPDNGSLVCSGHGTCECGKCVCQGHYSGKYCECDDNSCENHNGKSCNGKQNIWLFILAIFCNYIRFVSLSFTFKTHYLLLCVIVIGQGTCKCGICECKENYSGSACECSPSQDKCINDKGLCSGQGKCTCNRCQCNTGFVGDNCSTFMDACMLFK